jgi:hypothetical protein
LTKAYAKRYASSCRIYVYTVARITDGGTND